MTPRLGLATVALALALTLAASGRAEASASYLRVIAPRASIRSGPGDRFREVYHAERGEVFRVVDRALLGYWLRIVLPDGTFGWLMGDQTVPFEVAPGGVASKPGLWERIKNVLFAPSPILTAHVGLTFSAGALANNGLFIFRPSVVVDKYFALEAHLGEAVGSDGSILLYGVSGEIILWPEGPLVPFVALGIGGATSFPKINGVVQSPTTQMALDAGAGAMVVFRKRFILRFDFRNYTFFTPNSTQNRQEYSGGLAVYF